MVVLDEREIKGDLRARFPIDRKPYTEDYGYEDDSDLEEDDEEDIFEDELADNPQVVAEKPGDNSSVANIKNSDVKGNESLDMVSISDLDSLFSEPSEKGEAGTASSAHVGKVVVIEDVAFITYAGLLAPRSMR